jgi:diguanylate cyclase (GGDEF)-like protein
VQVHPSDDARTRRCTLRLRPLTDRKGIVNGAVVCVEDVTASVQLRAELERRASHDLLTRLLNRASALAALEGALASQGRRGTAAIFIDLDDFKGVNDRLGHLAGDELLRTVADRLAITVRGGDPLGRIGGDEFLVVCPGMAGPKPALEVADRIAHALRQPARLAGATLELRASVGVAHTRRPVRADLLVQHADAAMYCSKRHGEGRPVLYRPAVAQDGPTATEARRTTIRQSASSALQHSPAAAVGVPTTPAGRRLE